MIIGPNWFASVRHKAAMTVVLVLHDIAYLEMHRLILENVVVKRSSDDRASVVGWHPNSIEVYHINLYICSSLPYRIRRNEKKRKNLENSEKH